MNTPRFWPLDFDPEGEIYENVSWDLPGYSLKRKAEQARAKRRIRRAKGRQQP